MQMNKYESKIRFLTHTHVVYISCFCVIKAKNDENEWSATRNRLSETCLIIEIYFALVSQILLQYLFLFSWHATDLVTFAFPS